MSRLSVGLMLATALLPASPTFAHHSFAAYESDKTLTLTATVETFLWANPHAVLQVLAVAGGQGESAEMGPADLQLGG